MGVLRVQIREADKAKLTPARVHLRDAQGKFYYPKGCVPYERDGHFTVDGQFTISLPPGKVSILIEKGKEYRSISDEILMQSGEDHHVECEIHRWIDMAERGWYSGDLHIHRRLNDMAHLILAEDLNVAPDITVWNQWNEWTEKEIPAERVVEVDRTHAYGILTQEDERRGGAVLLMNLNSPVDLGKASLFYTANFAYCQAAHERGYIVDQEKPFWWEAPVNVALGGVDTIGILNNHIQREDIMDNEAWGRRRDTDRYPGDRGFVENVLDLYYKYLNMGLRLPISAGSASGVLKNPVGYNRLYVHLGHRFSYDRWFRGMKAGLAFATNGPMLFFSVDRCELGTTLNVPGGQEFCGKASLNVISQNVLDRAEILYNGEIIHEFSGGGSSELTKEFDISLKESGWIAARAFEKNESGTKNPVIRFAHTNPIYISSFLENPRVRGDQSKKDSRGLCPLEIGSLMKPRRDAAQYYLNWCRELLSASSADEKRYATDEQREEVESLYRRAISFYENLVASII